jgi:hypothetical protein
VNFKKLFKNILFKFQPTAVHFLTEEQMVKNLNFQELFWLKKPFAVVVEFQLKIITCKPPEFFPHKMPAAACMR